MRLTSFTDYALRVLMYAAARDGELITIEETAQRYRVSRTHLMKVVNLLTRAGYLKAVRGRAGGLMLGKPPQNIGLGEVVRATEPDLALVECFAGGHCLITPSCRLRGVLGEALQSFTATLDRYTLADLLLDPAEFGIAPPLEARAQERRMKTRYVVLAILATVFVIVMIGFVWPMLSALSVEGGLEPVIIMIVACFAIGGILIFLLLYSSRKGYDDGGKLAIKPDADRSPRKTK